MKYGMLIDAFARNAEHPKTFEIPPVPACYSLHEMQFVKIGLEGPNGNGERFWVQVKEIRNTFSNTFYIGTVDNDLQVFDIPIDALIIFQPQNVMQILE